MNDIASRRTDVVGRAAEPAALPQQIGGCLAGTRAWLQVVRLPSAQFGHCLLSRDSLAAPAGLSGGALVLRVGEDRIAKKDGRDEVRCEAFVYPRGDVPGHRYPDATHEWLLLFERRGERESGSAPATVVASMWSLILALRRTNAPAFDPAPVLERLRQALAPATRESPAAADARRILDREGFTGPCTGPLSRRLGINEPYLSRSFRRSYGVTITAYALLVRTLRAAALLWGSSASIMEIAARCGFSDQSHMTRSLTRFLATTPAEFRRLAQLEPAPQAPGALDARPPA